MRWGDREIVRQWANDRTTRWNSFRQGFIAKKEHARWFQSILKRPNENIAFLCRVKGRQRLGFVRFSRIQAGGTGWELHFTVSPSMRGKGLAGPMIKMAIRNVRKRLPHASFLARVKRQNYRSLRILNSLGFQAAAGKDTARRGVVLTMCGPLPIATKNSKIKARGRKTGCQGF